MKQSLWSLIYTLLMHYSYICYYTNVRLLLSLEKKKYFHVFC